MAAPDIVQFIDDWMVANAWTAPARQAFLDDFTSQYNYQENIDDGMGGTIPNPVSKSEFANQNLVLFVVQTVNSWRNRAARDAATYDPLVIE